VTLPVCDTTIQVDDLYGLPIGGAQVFLQFDNMTEFFAQTNPQGAAYFPQVPEGPFVARIYYLGTSGQVSGSSDSERILTATLVLSYPLIYTLVAFIAIAVSVIAMRRFRRHKMAWDYFFGPLEVG